MESLGLQPSEILEVVADRDVWQLNLELLTPQPLRSVYTERDRGRDSGFAAFAKEWSK